MIRDQNLKGGKVMNQKQPNAGVRCNVKSCNYNSQDQDYCSLRSIHVDARSQAGTGNAADESLCGSYEKK
jgi:hypothetical protein